MDLNTVTLNIKKYKNFPEFFDDLNLIWKNCKTYNLEGSAIYKQAVKMERLTKTFYRKQGNHGKTQSGSSGITGK